MFQGGEGWGVRGLLDSRHASIALRHAVTQCANPSGEFCIITGVSIHLAKVIEGDQKRL